MIAVNRKQSGFTMIEALVSMSILAVAATGLVVPFATGASVQAEGMHRSLGAKLGSDLLEKITADDYDSILATWTGYSEAQGYVKDSTGTVFTDSMYDKYSRYVTIKTFDLGGVDHFWITVQTYRDGKKMAQLSKLVGP